MADRLIPFTTPELWFIGVYLASLVVIGWLGFRSRRENSLQDFYLAGPGIGFVVLLLTLYATQYSGNTLFGFTGATYRFGFAWTMSVHFMTAIVVAYLVLAPGMYRLAKEHGFVTPADFLEHRFATPWLSLSASLIMIIAIANFLLAQMMAMGRALEGLTDRVDSDTAYTCGVIVLGLIIVVYETLGGFRAVAWTDVIQGSVLLVGFVLLVMAVLAKFGSLEDATRHIYEREREQQLASATEWSTESGSAESGSTGSSRPAAAVSQIPDSKVLPPDARTCLRWLSYVLMVGLGGALYPQAVQRVFAARSAAALRHSLAAMAFLPLSTALIAVIVWAIGLAYVPDLIQDGTDRADTVLTVICREVQEESLYGRWLVVILFSGILAAIMSTADSVLLSISSMFTKDIYARWIAPRASEAELTKLGKRCSWVVIGIAVLLAIQLRDTTLIKMLDRKFDLLVQLVPAYFLGLHWRRLRAGPTGAGLLLGVVLALSLAYGVPASYLYGVHPGLYALVVNTLVAVGGSWLAGPPAPIASGAAGRGR